MNSRRLISVLISLTSFPRQCPQYFLTGHYPISEVEIIAKKEGSVLFFLNRVITVILIIFVGLTCYLPIYVKHLGQDVAGYRLDEPISLSPPGYVESIVHIPREAPYEIAIRFYAADNDEVDKLWKEPIYIPIQIKIYSIPNLIPVKIKENMTGNNTERSHKHYKRIIAYSEQFMEEGDYKVIAYVLQDVPEVANIPVHLQMTMESKYVIKHYFGLDIAFGGIFLMLIFVDAILLIIFLILKLIQWN